MTEPVPNCYVGVQEGTDRYVILSDKDVQLLVEDPSSLRYHFDSITPVYVKKPSNTFPPWAIGRRAETSSFSPGSQTNSLPHEPLYLSPRKPGSESKVDSTISPPKRPLPNFDMPTSKNSRPPPKRWHYSNCWYCGSFHHILKNWPDYEKTLTLSFAQLAADGTSYKRFSPLQSALKSTKEM